MRLISANLNGIRSADSKGFFEWLKLQEADVVCLQETRAQPEQRQAPEFSPTGFTTCYVDAQRKGYSGVAIYSRSKPDRVTVGLGWKNFDSEGRWVQVDLGRLSLVSLYMPSGTSGDERQAFIRSELRFFRRRAQCLQTMR